MFGFLSSIKLLQFSGLLISALSPILIFAYLKSEKNKKKKVSSIIILKKLNKKKSISKKIKLPLRFYLELLALLLIAFAAAKPMLNDDRFQVAVVLDNSLSMAAKNEQDQTRLEVAKTDLKQTLDKLSSSLSYSLYTSSPKLKIFGPEKVGLSKVKNLINEVSYSASSDSLKTQLTKLAETKDYKQVFVVSDKTIDLTENDDKRSNNTTIQTIKVGSPVNNYFFVDSEITAKDLAMSSREIVSKISTSSNQTVNAVLKLFKANKNNLTLINQKQIRLKPEQITETRFSIKAYENANQTYKLTLESNQTPDAIKEDNFLWLTSDKTLGTKILLITPSGNPRALGLENIKGLNVGKISPSNFIKLTDRQINNYSLLIFHRSAPQKAYKIPTLLILPPENNFLFPISKTSSNSKVTSWKSDHPLSSYLKVPLLKLNKTLIINTPPWAQSVINVEDGSILTAGESQGIRFACLGLEILPYEGSRSPLSSVLILNLINWLNNSSQITSKFLTGFDLKLAGQTTWVIKDPNNKIETIENNSNKSKPYELKNSGIYQLTSIQGTDEKSIKKENNLIAVNSIFPEESKTFEDVKTTLPKTINKEKTENKTDKPLWPTIALVALLILIVESLLILFSKKES